MTKNPKILLAALPSHCRNYHFTLHNCGFDCVFPTHPDTPEQYLSLCSLTDLVFDLLLLPGGGDISCALYGDLQAQHHTTDELTDLIQFQLLLLAYQKRKPVLGICKGMQLLNVFFGGTLYSHLPTAEIHIHTEKDLMHSLDFTPTFPLHSKIAGQDKDFSMVLYHLLSRPQTVNSAHHQGVQQLGSNLLTLQYSQDYLPETIIHTQLPLLGLQWHPERLDGVADKYFPHLVELLLQTSRL